jgi:hypothetical protein
MTVLHSIPLRERSPAAEIADYIETTALWFPVAGNHFASLSPDGSGRSPHRSMPVSYRWHRAEGRKKVIEGGAVTRM